MLLCVFRVKWFIGLCFDIVDVVGVVTKVKHDKNFYPDGRVTRSVTFKLNDQWCVFSLCHSRLWLVDERLLQCVFFSLFLYFCRKGFWCEVTGDLVDEFHKGVLSVADGLPIVVLQFARICIVQGLFVRLAEVHFIFILCECSRQLLCGCVF
jgi:hypothetical protein